MSNDALLNIERFLPHRAPIRLIDRLINADDEHVVVEAQVPTHGRFVRDGVMPAWVSIEYMAQAIAAWAGARAVRRGDVPQIGLLLGTRKLELHRADIPCGALLSIRAHCELETDNGLGMFACHMMLGDEVVARANLSVYEPEDSANYLARASS